MPGKKKKRTLGWHHKTLKVPTLWDKGVEGKGTRIAVLDTGIASVSGLDRTTFEFLDPDGNEIGEGDIDSHGTQAASVTASNNRDVLGIAPRAALSSYRVLDGGDREGKVERALAAIASRDDIDVVLCAFTMESVPDPIKEVIREIAMRGVVVVAAAGNDASVECGFPEHTPHVVTVAGLTVDLAVHRSAQIGAWIDIAAPGEDLRALLPDEGQSALFGDSSGGSAVVAGVAALMLGTRTGARRRKLGMALDGLFRSTAKPLAQEQTTVGAGLVNPLSLLDVIEKGF